MKHANQFVSHIKGKTFKREEFHIGGQRFQDCRFKTCNFTFSGPVMPQQRFPRQAMSDYFIDCKFENCVLKPQGDAANCIQFLSELYQDEASQPMVKGLMKQMRKGFKAPQIYSWPTHV